MRLRYDEDFVEAAVTLCASGRSKSVPALQVARFHREREKLYAVLDADERNAAFFKLHLDWFREWGLEKLLAGMLADFPQLGSALDILAFRKSCGKHDEGAELYVNKAEVRSGVIALRTDRLQSDGSLTPFLRHELTHLQDMVDPTFGYIPALSGEANSPRRQGLARERYRLLWDITIDGRLTAAGYATVAGRQQRWEEFARAFSFWPDRKQREIFESLWSCCQPSHAKLAELVEDPRELRTASRPLPGASCPLCYFPTFDWADPNLLSNAALEIAAAEFPEWSPDRGLCGRCGEAYEVAAKHRSVAVPDQKLPNRAPVESLYD